MKKGNYIEATVPTYYRDSGVAYIRRELPQVVQWEERDGRTLHQIGRDGCMIYGDSISVTIEDLPELRKLSKSIADRLEESIQTCCDYCRESWIGEELNLSEIEYLWTYKRSEWFYTLVLDHNFLYFAEDIRKRCKENKEKS